MPSPKAPAHRTVYLISAVLLLFSLFTAFGDRGFIHLWRLRQEKRKLDHENFLLQRENEVLRERIRRLRHDNLYLEKVVREELGFTRPGEIVYRFVSPEAKNQTAGLMDSPARLRWSSEQEDGP